MYFMLDKQVDSEWPCLSQRDRIAQISEDSCGKR